MTNHTERALPALGYAAIIGGVAIGGFVGFGCFFFPSLMIFMRPILAEFGWGRADLSLAFSAALLGCGIGAPLCGHLIDRFGVRPVALASAVLMGVLMFALSFFRGTLALFVALTFAIGFIGAPTTSLGYVSVLPQWFNRRLGAAIALATVGYGLGQSVWPVVSQHLIAWSGSWREGYRIVSAFPILGGVIAMLLLRERRRPAAPGETGLGAVGLTVAQGVRGRHMWTMLIAFFLVSACALAFEPQIPLLLTDRGFTVAQAAQGPSLVGLGFLISRLLCGVLVDIFPATLVSCFFFMMSGIGFWLFHDTSSLALLRVACVLVGFAIGTEQDMMAYLVRRYLGMRAFGTFFGFNMAAFCLGGVAVPPLLGLYYDHYKNYSLPLYVMMGCMFLAALLVTTLGRYQFAAHVKRHSSGTLGEPLARSS